MKREIKFNSLYSSNNYTKNLEKLFADYELFRQKHFSLHCLQHLNEVYTESDLFLTHSATGALEMIALALNIKEGDEIILPSFTFVSTANAFALRGAKLVFVDIELDTLGVDPTLVESAITEKTKAIIGVHYGGHACKIEALKTIADKHSLILIEDAAMAFGSKHNDQDLGSIGDFGVVSFDITKHISATQGGLLICNNQQFTASLSEIYHTGTNRSAFEEGDVPYYEWVNLGSKYQMPETNAAVLAEQLDQKDAIFAKLESLSNLYYKEFPSLEGVFENCSFPVKKHNLHEIYILLSSKTQRDALARFMSSKGVEVLFHYIPLHGAKFAEGKYPLIGAHNTEEIADCLLRLPLHTNLKEEDVQFVCSSLKEYIQE